MEVNRIKDKRKRLEAEILKKITEYEEETNTKVDELSLNRSGKHRIITNINVKTNK